MWRRAICWQLIKTLTLSSRRSAAARSLVPPAVSAPVVFSRCFSFTAKSDSKRVKDVTPIKTGHEGKDIRNAYYYRKIAPRGLDEIDLRYRYNEAPVVVESYYDRRVVGCNHGHVDDMCGLTYIWVFKGKIGACRVCKQHFELDVVGPGTPPP